MTLFTAAAATLASYPMEIQLLWSPNYPHTPCHLTLRTILGGKYNFTEEEMKVQRD